MKFTVTASALLKKLSLSSGIVGNKNVRPILEDFLFELSDNELTITSSNNQTSIITKMEVTGEEDGSIAIPAKLLIDTLKALPDQPVTIEVDSDTFKIQLSTVFGLYKLAGDNPLDFTPPTVVDTDNWLSLPTDQVNRVLNSTLFAVSDDEVRVNMQGLYMEVVRDKVVFVGTDAHKLVKYEISNINSLLKGCCLIPKKSLSTIKSVFGISDSCQISFNENTLYIKVDQTMVIVQLLNEKFPDYNAVIPSNSPYLLTLERYAFLSSLKRLILYANKTTNQIVMNLSEGSLTISSQDIDFSNEATEQLSCSYNGETMNIGFNAKFLTEMLSVLDSTNVQLELTDPATASILTPSENNENENIIMLVMPAVL